MHCQRILERCIDHTSVLRKSSILVGFLSRPMIVLCSLLTLPVMQWGYAALVA